MNEAERRRDERIARLDDRALLESLTGPGSELTGSEAEAFGRMLRRLRAGEVLSKKERTWAEEVARRVTPVRAGDAPKGRDVPLPAALQVLPKRPPPRPRNDED